MPELVCCSACAVSGSVGKRQCLRLPAVLLAYLESIFVGGADFKPRSRHAKPTSGIYGITSPWNVLIQSQIPKVLEDDGDLIKTMRKN